MLYFDFNTVGTSASCKIVVSLYFFCFSMRIENGIVCAKIVFVRHSLFTHSTSEMFTTKVSYN